MPTTGESSPIIINSLITIFNWKKGRMNDDDDDDGKKKNVGNTCEEGWDT